MHITNVITTDIK